MEIRAEEISQVIRDQIKDYEKKIEVSETGTVLSVGDGIARVYGVEKAMAMEMLEFPGGIFGLASIWRKTTWASPSWVTITGSKRAIPSRGPEGLPRCLWEMLSWAVLLIRSGCPSTVKVPSIPRSSGGLKSWLPAS
jgi:hypothetical protein